MIDITIDESEIRVENKTYHLKKFTTSNKETLVECIQEILNKSKYSGESITLWKVFTDNSKLLINEW